MPGCYRLSKRQGADLLVTGFAIQLATGRVVTQQQVVSAALAQPVEELTAYVQQPPACTVDETSWRQAHPTKPRW